MDGRFALAVAGTVVLAAGSACAGPTTPHAQPGTVRGVVLSAPRCPGPERAGHPCLAGPVAGAVVDALSGRSTAGSTHTDDSGGFNLRLPAGRYLIRTTNIGGYRSTAQQSVTVRAGSIREVTLTLDTGIR